jgi:hypothetical protein
MRQARAWAAGVAVVMMLAGAPAPATAPSSLGQESLATLRDLGTALRRLQNTDAASPDLGAIRCPACGVLHTRAAEAVFPFAVLHARDRSAGYGASAMSLARWLMSRQESDGSWKETPEEWTGTTTDQLLMLARAYERLAPEMTPAEREAWTSSMRRAADYLTDTMSPSFASINYCATTSATLATMHRLLPNPRWAAKAKALAWQVAATMDEDGFIAAEGERSFEHKYGADLGYEMDMSLWGLALYARITGDRPIHDHVLHALRTHLPFVYPQGAIDGSWGIRSNKWTTFGSQTADGSQFLFALMAPEEPRATTAALRNLAYLRTMMRDGYVGYGPHSWELIPTPCIYPTFARAKNLALTVELGPRDAGDLPPLPADVPSWVRTYPTVDVAVVRTASLMATISAYRYKDITKRDRSKYMHRVTGGSIASLWADGYGYVQLASQTAYERWEPMHFPDAPGILSLTPRIEFSDANGTFTNLYDFDARLSVRDALPAEAIVSTSGELSDRKLAAGGIGFTWTHTFRPRAVEKTVILRYRTDADVRIIEPIVRQEGVRFERVGDRAVRIVGNNRRMLFELVDGQATIEAGVDEARYWAPFPAVRAYPLVVRIARQPGRLSQSVTYRLTME